jgi:hypothetical protein
MRIFAASLVVMGLASSTAMAQSRPACIYGTDQTVTSLTECATYERTRVSCAETQSPSDNDVWIGPSRKLSRAMGELIIRIARIAEISNDDVVERMQEASEKMLTTMSGSCANFSVLMRRYEEFCTKLTDNPSQLLANARNCMVSDR